MTTLQKYPYKTHTGTGSKLLQRKLDHSTRWPIPHSSVTWDVFWQVLLPLLLKEGEKRGRASHPTADPCAQTYISKKTAVEREERSSAKKHSKDRHRSRGAGQGKRPL